LRIDTFLSLKITLTCDRDGKIQLPYWNLSL